MMGDAMDGVEHGSRRIAKPKSRKLLPKPTKKRKSTGADRSTETSSAASLNLTPSKKARVSSAVTVTEKPQSWATIAQNHTALLESHAQFLSKLLQQSQPTSSRTPALVGFLSRTHEMLAQAKTIEAISPPIPSSPAKAAPNTSVPRVSTPPKPKMETLSQDLQSIVLEKRKRSRSPSPDPSPKKLASGEAESEREGSPVKKIKSAPETPVVPMKSSLKSKLGIRTAEAQYSKADLPRTPTVVTASTSAALSGPVPAKQEVKTEGKAETEEEVSLMEPDDFAAEVAARLKAKEKRKHKLVEGSKGKRRRRSSTVDAPREKRQRRDNSVGAGHARRRVSAVVNGDGDEETRGRR